MNIYESVLIYENDIEKVRKKVQQILNLDFILHESNYYGMYYLCKTSELIDEIKIMRNYIDDDWQFIDDKDCPIVIQFDKVKNNVEYLDIIYKKMKNYIKKIIISEIDEQEYREYIYVDNEKKLIKTIQRYIN